MTYTPPASSFIDHVSPLDAGPGAKINAAFLNGVVAALVEHDAVIVDGVISVSPDLVIQVSNSSGDTDAITSAIAEQTTGGKVSGRWVTTQNAVARITSPTTITLGYTNTQAGNWATDTTTEKVRLALDILPDANLGAALTIKGGYGVELDINVLGGGARGSVTDAAMTRRTTSADATVTLGATGTSTMTSASASFTSADVGASVAVPGGGAGGATIYGNITAVASSTSATLGLEVSTTVTSASVIIGGFTVSSPQAIAAGLSVGAVVFIPGAGPSPEGVAQPLAASVRSINAGAGTFTVSESCWTNVTSAAMTWFDVAVRVEDCVGLKLNVYGKGFQGYLLAADATNDTSLRLRSCQFPSITGNGCGGTLFWKSIEAFGSIGHIMSNTIYGDYVGMGADLHWDHWEGGISQPVQQLARTYLWFDRQGQVNNLSISAGDRATEAAVLMTGDSNNNAAMGRFAQIRATMYQAVGTGATITNGSNQITNLVSKSLTFKIGQTVVAPGVPDGTTITAVSGTGNGYTSGSPGTLTMSANATATTTGQIVYGATSDGLKLIGVSSVIITHLDTARCVAGLRVVGGGSIGIRVMHHRSGTSDVTAMVVQPGVSGTPRLDVFADYRFILHYALDIASGLTSSANIKFRGYVDIAHLGTGGGSGKYAARSGSSTASLDIAGLHQKAITSLTGFIDPATVALKGQSQARLGNETPVSGKVYVTDGLGGFTTTTLTPPVVGTSQTVLQNTTTDTIVAGPLTIPANTVVAGSSYRMQVWGNIDNVASATLTLRVRVGGLSGTSLWGQAITVGSTRTSQAFWHDSILVFRAAASSSTAATVGGFLYNATAGTNNAAPGTSTNLNMTVNRDLVMTAVWAGADVANILRVEGFTIEKLV